MNLFTTRKFHSNSCAYNQIINWSFKIREEYFTEIMAWILLICQFCILIASRYWFRFNLLAIRCLSFDFNLTTMVMVITMVWKIIGRFVMMIWMIWMITSAGSLFGWWFGWSSSRWWWWFGWSGWSSAWGHWQRRGRADLTAKQWHSLSLSLPPSPPSSSVF